MVTRGSFHDPYTGQTYVFELNPRQGGSPKKRRNLTVVPVPAPDGTPVIFEGPPDIQRSEISGVMLTEAHYKAFKNDWFDRPNPIVFTDHLGRQFRIIPEELDATLASKIHHPWRHDYTLRYLIIEELNP